MYGLFGALAGLVLSAGLVFVAEYNDSSYRTPDEVNQDLGIPVLAAIPREANPLGTATYNAITPPIVDEMNQGHQG
jgi:hypothetical protein